MERVERARNVRDLSYDGIGNQDLMFDFEFKRHEQAVESEREREKERRMRQRIHVRYEYELGLEDCEAAGMEVMDIMKGHKKVGVEEKES